MATERPQSSRPSAIKQTAAKAPAVKTAIADKNTTFKAKKPSAPKPVVFSIPKGGGIWYKLRQENIVIYDKEKGHNREIRYCPAERSIYTDEQQENARREQIVFREKTLMVNQTMPNLIEFLKTHPDNKSNGGSVFIEINNESNAEEDLEKEFAVHDAISYIKESGIETLIPIALSYGISSDLSSLEIKRALIQQAKGNAKTFMEAINSPLVQLKALVITALDFQILKAKADGMYWFDSNQIIIPTAAGQDTKTVFTRFLMSERGYEVREELDRQLNSL